MSGDGTRELIRELAEGLSPVHPIAPLRRVALGVAAAWFGAAALGALVLGLRPDLVEATLGPRGVAAVFGALTVAGVAGLLVSLALGVPGREPAARAGGLVGAFAFSLALVLATLLLVRGPWVSSFGPHDLRCLGTACAVGVLPALGVIAYVARAAPFRPLAAVLAAAAGTAALGAVAAQASCPLADPRHLLVGHVLAPVAGVLLLTLPLLAVLRCFARR